MAGNEQEYRHEVMKEEQEARVRIDRWLWAARFFKTRSLAARAVKGGHVQINGERVKPARLVGVGDQLRIRRGIVEFTVMVQKLGEKRGPATIARTMYEETEASEEARRLAREQMRLLNQDGLRPRRRPDKRDRRKIRKFLRKD